MQRYLMLDNYKMLQTSVKLNKAGSGSLQILHNYILKVILSKHYYN